MVRVYMVQRRRIDGGTDCVITTRPPKGFRVIGTMKATNCAMELGKSRINFDLMPKKKGDEDGREKSEKGSPDVLAAAKRLKEAHERVDGDEPQRGEPR